MEAQSPCLAGHSRVRARVASSWHMWSMGLAVATMMWPTHEAHVARRHECGVRLWRRHMGREHSEQRTARRLGRHRVQDGAQFSRG